ncbi:hypothetical protein GON09_001638 [Rhodococcus sp. B50]|nr:hypothetical protein [Rhodococcus sp. B50]
MFAEDRGRTPDRESVLSFFDSRMHLVSALARRIADAPGSLDYPYWVKTDLTVDEVVTVHETRSSTFEDWLESVARLSADGVDAGRCPWQVHVFPGVPDPDEAGATVTVAAIQASHAMLVGSSARGLLEALFGEADRPLEVDGLAPPADTTHPVAATLHGILRLVIWPVLALVGLVRANLEARRHPQDPLPGMLGSDSAPDGSVPQTSRRVIRILRPDLSALAGRSWTVTALGLTAVSLAMERYYRERGQALPSEYAAVPVALGESAAGLGVNRVAGGLVPLHVEIPEPAQRAATIADSLARERARVDSSGSIDAMHRTGATPYPVYRRVARALAHALASGTVPGVATALSSVNCGADVRWTVPWGHLKFIAGVQALVPRVDFMHTFARAGDAFAVTVMAPARDDAHPDRDIDRYVELLDEGFAEVSAAVSRAGK